jgi:hypothetical protein
LDPDRKFFYNYYSTPPKTGKIRGIGEIFFWRVKSKKNFYGLAKPKMGNALPILSLHFPDKAGNLHQRDQ